ncbi:unnamed protein product [Polarella glacialis]|uniref:Deacetylase sirtuin-type domain-containing protein n=1 Tax=Polarella glacialis TaxID=89957 RepID=A0A813HVC0_POLGL|nr:unnamed protein product [Polarella glacialis]CAE8641278.1 unnamed protein product [Polarella glacialis]
MTADELEDQADKDLESDLTGSVELNPGSRGDESAEIPLHETAEVLQISPGSESPFVQEPEPGVGGPQQVRRSARIAVQKSAAPAPEVAAVRPSLRTKAFCLNLSNRSRSRRKKEPPPLSQQVSAPSAVPAAVATGSNRANSSPQAQDELMQRDLAQAADWLLNADVLLVGSGAGMGVDSGLATCRGPGSAGAWPGLDRAGLSYETLCSPKWFQKDPRLAWAFWSFCHGAYQSAHPHTGYSIVRKFSELAPLGSFSFTSNIDGHWQRSGWPEDKLVEIHGDVRWFQCSVPCCERVWESPEYLDLEQPSFDESAGHEDDNSNNSNTGGESCQVHGALPTCPECGAVARPAVMLFGKDRALSRERLNSQLASYNSWLENLQGRSQREHLRIVCLEIGCGVSVPTVRDELESVLTRFPGAVLIRVNPHNSEVSTDFWGRSVSLAMSASQALDLLQRQVVAARAAQRICTFIVRDHGNIARAVEAPMKAPALRVLHLLELSGVRVRYGQLQGPRDPPQEPYVVFFRQRNSPEFNSLASCAPGSCFFELDTGLLSPVLACFQAMHIWFDADSSQIVSDGIDWCQRIVGDLAKQIVAPQPQDEIRPKSDLRTVAAMLQAVEEAVLPRFGLTYDNAGLKALHAKIWLYGTCDAHIFRLADEYLDLSCIRLAGHLPWSDSRVKDTFSWRPPGQKSQQRLLGRCLRVAELQRRAQDRRAQVELVAQHANRVPKPVSRACPRAAVGTCRCVVDRRCRGRALLAQALADAEAFEDVPRRDPAPSALDKAADAAKEESDETRQIDRIKSRVASPAVAPRPAPAVASRHSGDKRAIPQLSADNSNNNNNNNNNSSSNSNSISNKRGAKLVGGRGSPGSRSRRVLDNNKNNKNNNKNKKKKNNNNILHQSQEGPAAKNARPQQRLKQVSAAPAAISNNNSINNNNNNNNISYEVAFGGLCRGSTVRILDDPTHRGMTGILADYDRATDTWQVHGNHFGSKSFPAASLAFFVGKRPISTLESDTPRVDEEKTWLIDDLPA